MRRCLFALFALLVACDDKTGEIDLAGADAILTGELAGDYAGYSVAGLGDVDGDTDGRTPWSAPTTTTTARPTPAPPT